MSKKESKTASYEHDSSKRANLPTSQTEPLMDATDRAPIDFTPTMRERDDEPVLAWQRGISTVRNGGGGIHNYQSTHDAYPLYIREKIHPGAFVESLKKTDGSHNTLFESFNGLPSEDAKYEWYQHKGNWQNRIIHGESAKVMASLAAREDLSGQVQMIYFDPPYGINFKSNFQTKTDNLNTPDNRNAIPNDTRTITAFRDTYKRGVHSYLDQMLEKLALCRELLTNSGSIFVQIGEENLHRMALLLDEVFGAGNRVSQITFATTSSTSSNTLPSIANYLLWYAKDATELKYFQLYEPTDIKGILKQFSSYAQVELKDGTSRYPSSEERRTLKFPTDSRLYMRTSLSSQGKSTTGRSEPYFWNGVERQCGENSQWTVSHEGLDRLGDLGRLDASSDPDITTLRWKKYANEVPGKKISNIWNQQMYPNDKRYVVQTADLAIERCILMTTEPGDLVFDPTCGSGTTAAVAEKWGRRWITCDTSPIAVSIARQRVITNIYPYWTLANTAAGISAEAELSGKISTDPASAKLENSKDPASGYVYNRVPYVSAATLAYEQKPDPIYLVDQPYETKNVARLASPFTVESSSPWTYGLFTNSTSDIDSEDSKDEVIQNRNIEHSEFVEMVIEQLKLQPIKASGNMSAEVSSIQVMEIESWVSERSISHLATYLPVNDLAQKPRRAGLFIAPEDVTVSADIIRKAVLDTAAQFDDANLMIVVALAFEAEASQEKLGKVNVMRVQMHRDLLIRDLKPEKNHEAFVMLGQPEMGVSFKNNEELVVELLGYDTYDPSNGETRVGFPNDVGCWMIDTNYDGESFFARRIHFPGSEDDKIMKKLKRELGKTLDELRWDRMLSTKSAPFPVPESGQIAVKIITTAGNEMSVVKDVE